MKSMRTLATAVSIALLALPVTGLAHEADSLVLRLGAVMVEPDESSSDVKVDGIGAVAGAKVGVDNNTQLGINLVYKFTDHLGLGVLGATPFKHDIAGADGLSGVGKLGSTKHLPPTITLQYFPLSPSSRVQPYVGVGINYTTFFEEKTDDNLTAVFQAVADANLGANAVKVTGVDMKLDDSFGLAAELGVDLLLTDRLMLNAAIWYADIGTEAQLTGKTAQNVNIKAKVDVDIDPMVYMVSVGYRF